MSSVNQLPRSTRRSDYNVTPGQLAFGPTAWLAFDTLDIVVWRQFVADGPWERVTSGVTLSLSATPAGFVTATFATAPSAAVPAPIKIRIEGRRTHERITDVTRAGALNTAAMERELDKMSTVLQEVRRDVDEVIRPNEDLDAAVVAAQTAATTATGAAGTATGAAGAASASAGAAAASAALLATQSLANGTDLNTLTTRGTFVVTSPANAPDATAGYRWVVEVVNDGTGGTSGLTQTARLLVGGSAVATYERRRPTGSAVWDAWALIGGAALGPFATRAAAIAAIIPAIIVGLTLVGYTTVGDAPPATYVRAASEPAHPGKFQSAGGTWWERSDADRFPEQSGAVGNGTTDDTTAVSNWLSELQLDTRAEGRLLAGKQYRITSQLPDITRQVTIRGGGVASCGFLRDYTGTARKGLLHFTGASSSQGANNSRISAFYIIAAAGTTGGALLSGLSTSDYALSGVVAEDMWLTTLGTNTHTNTIDWDGTAKTTGAIGLRDLSFRNLHIFGANGMSVYLAGIVGLGWYGGGIYGAGGSHASSGGMQITGTSTVKSSVLAISITTSSGLNLTQITSAEIRIPSIGAISGTSINNDGTCVDCGVYGKPTGTVVSNWTTSGIRRPGAAFATS
jgi:hypothetical protein